MRLSDYTYHLPRELIAQTPPAQRDASRLLVLDRRAGNLGHRQFVDLPQLIGPDDLLVLNNTKVIPARLRFPDRNAELFLLEPQSSTRWRCWGRPGK
ncbi:MAG: S-adenosylmethionine:tRNA ribosyltransferase-isomerase, partial [Verrucomicrobia bacterium]|nr:S-adenosylmethionine:tRNA ribosyltransferase-isomerase [Verrucomicrobiota bacterium]